MPSVPHYENALPVPPPIAPLTPPRYTKHYSQTDEKGHADKPKGELRKSFWERTTDDPNAFFALWVAVFTAVLAISTIGLWIATGLSVRVARRALEELERPFITAVVTDAGFRNVFGTGLDRGRFELTLRNVGRTPATLTRIEYNLVLARHGGIADPVNPSAIGGRELPVGTITAPDHPYSEGTNLRLAFLEDEDDIVEGRQSVWLIGFARCTDIFSAHYIIGFTQVFDFQISRFVSRGDQRYNYARRERPKKIPKPSSRG
jgi:hypothetical protein